MIIIIIISIIISIIIISIINTTCLIDAISAGKRKKEKLTELALLYCKAK